MIKEPSILHKWHTEIMDELASIITVKLPNRAYKKHLDANKPRLIELNERAVLLRQMMIAAGTFPTQQ
jgi:hypothetical protein